MADIGETVMIETENRKGIGDRVMIRRWQGDEKLTGYLAGWESGSFSSRGTEV